MRRVQCNIVKRIRRGAVGKVGVDCVSLVVGLRKDVRETAAGSERSRGRLWGLARCAACGEDSGADSCDIWTVDRRLCGKEGVVSGADPVTRRHATIACRDDDGNSLQAKFHPLVALSELVVDWETVLVDAVRDRNHIRRRIGSTLLRLIISAWIWVWIGCVNRWVIAGLIECGIGTIRAVDAIEEGVEDAFDFARACCFVIKVIDLKEHDFVGVYKRIYDLKIKVGLAARESRITGRWSSIYTVKRWRGVGGDVGSKSAEEYVEIGLIIELIIGFVDADRVAGVAHEVISDIVENLHTFW